MALSGPPWLVVLHHDIDHTDVERKLLPHLHGLPVWHRRMLQGGDLRSAQRQRVSEAPLVLAALSADFFTDPELTDLLELALSRNLDGRCVLMPLRLRACTLPADRLAELSFIALGAPASGATDEAQHHTHALSNRRDQDEAALRVGEAVRERWKSDLPALQPASAQRDYRPGADAVLTVILRRTAPGSATIEVAYSTPRLGVFRRTTTSAQALRAAKDDGAALFRLLFPDGGAAVLETVTGLHNPSPHGLSLRVRVLPGDAELAALPFHRTSERDLPLSLWTFECTRVELPTPARELRLPCRIAAWGRDPGPVEALRQILHRVSAAQASEDHLHVYLDPAPLPLDLQVLCAHGSAPPAGLSALTAVSADTLVIYLNGPGWESLALHLADTVPVVLCGDGSEAAANVFLDALLVQQQSPALALRTVAAVGLRPPVLYTRAETFTVRAVPSERPTQFSPWRVDRDAQRALVDRHVNELLTVGAQRVEAIIAYAAPRNHLDQFSRQALDYLDRRKVEYRRVPVQLPARRGPGLRAALPEELRQQLSARDGEDTTALLRRWAGPRNRLLWIEWGCHQASDLKPADLLQFLEFTSAELTRDCPRDLRIVSFIALEAPRDKHPTLAEKIGEAAVRLFTDRFRCSLLPPLDSIQQMDLLSWLRDPHNSTCPPMRINEAARLIIEKTGGDYESVVALLHEAERVTWSTLLRRLGQGAGAPADPNDDSW